MRKFHDYSFVALLVLMVTVLSACDQTPRSTSPSGSTGTPGNEVVLVGSVAASLTDAINSAQAEFVLQHPKVRLQFNFGSSGTLAQQIVQGAPADFFISAGQGAMNDLIQSGAVTASSVENLVTNRIVLVQNSLSKIKLRDWSDLTKAEVAFIAIGDPAHVPAGQYGQEVLEHLNLWAGVQKKLVLDQNVREVLHHVESGGAQAGIVYSTDAATSDKVVIIAEAPVGSHRPIVYPMSIVEASAHQAEARLFLDFLNSAAGQALFEKFGFGAAQ